MDEREEATLLAALEALADPAVRETMGERARELVEREHRLDRVAEAYAAALEQLAGGPVVDANGCCTRSPPPPPRSAWTGTTRPSSRRGCARSALATSAVEQSRARTVELVRAVPMWVWVGGLVVVSAGIRYALARRIVAPWIMVDELVYSELAKSLADAGRFLLRGEHTAAYGLRLPGAAQPGVGALPLRAAGLRGGEGDQRGRRLARCDPGVPARPSRVLAPVRVRGGGAGDVGADTALRRDADDRERVLPGVPARRAGDGRSGSSGPTSPARCSFSAPSCSRT